MARPWGPLVIEVNADSLGVDPGPAHQRQLALLERCAEFVETSSPAIEQLGDRALAGEISDNATVLAVVGSLSYLIAIVRSCACQVEDIRVRRGSDGSDAERRRRCHPAP
jgi:hypothetical protein